MDAGAGEGILFILVFGSSAEKATEKEPTHRELERHWELAKLAVREGPKRSMWNSCDVFHVE